ncbi:hypothetical protein [Kribbella speibonae]|uniref:Uncharacterized protein n=1 Tax=Kribbella speibonae TaxID=1572660 RepID=A0A4R0JBF2_9ACTN|nr:hypothetical protein [Kribbella speibonae]TCC38895.1 hypothetical protein E0H92_21250 [Kribbella speibonae]
MDRGRSDAEPQAHDEGGVSEMQKLMNDEDAVNDRPEHEETAFRPGVPFWGSVVNGWFTAGVRTDWSRRVTEGRGFNHDRIRPYVTRGALLVGLGGSLVAVDASLWALLWLAVGSLQTILEIWFEPAMRARYEKLAAMPALGQNRFGRWITHIAYLNYEKSVTNVTGLLGALAAMGNMAAVLYGTRWDAEPSWVRVLALCFAMLYLASGAIGPLADAAMYSPLTLIPTWLVVLFRWAWVIVVGLFVVLLLTAQGSRFSWGAELPYALMVVVAIGYYPMLRCREFERAVAAGADVADDLAHERYKAIVLDLHNLLQPVKHSLALAAANMPNQADRAELDRFLRDMRYTYDAARSRTLDLSQGLGMPLEDHLRSIASAERVKLDVDLRLPSHLGAQQAQRIKQWLLVLVQNSVQAYRSWDDSAVAWIGVRADALGGDLVVEVKDLLEPVPSSVWNDPDRTLGRVRADIEALGGTMQQRAGDRGKVITVRWTALQLIKVLGTTERGAR